MISEQNIKDAYSRIQGLIRNTPILESHFLEQSLGHKIFFKAESLQVTGAFKIRGVLNALLLLKEQNSLPKKIVAYSSGNHAFAVAWAAKHFGLKAKIYMANFSSPLKMQIVRDLGAELITTRTRIEAEIKSREEGSLNGNLFLHPSANEDIIAGAASLCYETLIELKEKNSLPDAIFASCGGGALISGSFLAKNIFDKNIKMFGAEPKIANDASRSYKKGCIVGYTESPKTIADGARTLKVSELAFSYLKQIDGFIESSEEEIIYWTAWLNHLLKINCEPTCALAMASAYKWLKKQTSPQTILVMLSGGNNDQESMKKVWKKDHLQKVPRLPRHKVL